MLAAATTTISVFRGTTLDGWGDPVDLDIPVMSGVVASIGRRSVEADTESSGVPQEIQKAECRVTAHLDIRTNDRIQDEFTGETWQVIKTLQTQHPGTLPDMRIYLQRTE